MAITNTIEPDKAKTAYGNSASISSTEPTSNLRIITQTIYLGTNYLGLTIYAVDNILPPNNMQDVSKRIVQYEMIILLKIINIRIQIYIARVILKFFRNRIKGAQYTTFG